MKLDIATLLLMNLIVNAVSVWAMAIIWRENRMRYPGIGYWLADMALQTTGMGLLLLRGVAPDFISIVLANVSILSGAVCLLIGLERFVCATSRYWFNALFLVASTLVLVHFTHFHPDIQAREIAISMTIIMIMGQACWLLFKRAATPFRVIANITGYVLLGYVAVSALRIFLTLGYPPQSQDFFTARWVASLAMTLYTTLSICLSICLILVVNRRLLADVLALKNELEIMATHDPLTGLPNRSLFHDRFAVALENAKRSKSRLAIMYIDIDNFKEINDTQGHAAGDELLVESARRLTRALRKVDTVARFGGDEFVLLLWDVEADDDARDIAEKILTELRKPFDLDGRHVSVSGSIGIALYPKDGVDANVLIKKADEALYLAKTSGKGGYRFILS